MNIFLVKTITNVCQLVMVHVYKETIIGIIHIHNLLTKYQFNQNGFEGIDKCYYVTQLELFRTNFFFVN